MFAFRLRSWLGIFLLLATGSSHAAELHVSLTGGHVPPFTTWANAATNIQAAVDAASAGDTIRVTNGTYAAGGRTVYNTMTNRVAVAKSLTLRSVNGPDVTVIDGSWNMRCAYLTNGAVLTGFTLTRGAARTSGEYHGKSGGGVWCESGAVVSNCIVVGNSADGYGGGAYSGSLNNCTLIANSANWINYGGGGAYNSTLTDCTVVSNSAYYGGGTLYGRLNRCTVVGNSASQAGGGSYFGVLDGCTLRDNSASEAGGGNYSGVLSNCMVAGNSAYLYGGGAFNSTLYNCTVTGNSASSGGGVNGGALTNCIVYYNSAPNGTNTCLSTLSYSCTTPLPASGVSNISAEPQLSGTSHLSANSPCRGAGSAAASGLDIDGEPWASAPSIGCDEYWSGSLTGVVSTTIVAGFTNVAVGFSVNLQACISGRVGASSWDFGDGTVVSNRPYTSHAWAAAGDYTVLLRAYNETYPSGVAAAVVVRVVIPPTHYVSLASVSPVPPYNSWATAATNIQDAVDVATVGGALVLVSNGVYEIGACAVYGMSNRVAVTKPLTVRSVNGPEVTIIRGYPVQGPKAVRCVYLSHGAALTGFTLTQGATQLSNYPLQYNGGGLWCEWDGVVSNCTLTNNAATFGGGTYGGTLNNCTVTGNRASQSGGGAANATLNNCIVKGNSAAWGGGGAYASSLNNCMVKGNSAAWGGGAYASSLNNCTLNNCTIASNSASSGYGGISGGTLNNCIVYFNSGQQGGSSLMSYCCTTPLAPGLGNITNAPLFVDLANGNLRLQSNSPCVNVGLNGYAPAVTDLDGRPRVADGRVDIGAYEFQPGISGLFIGWLRQFNLPTGGSADFADSDLDGHNNWQEWRADTIPTNALSRLVVSSLRNGPSGLAVTWQSVATRSYFLERSTNLTDRAFLTLVTNTPGYPATTTFTDSTATNGDRFFYRVGVQ